jgi:hypothetical protein
MTMIQQKHDGTNVKTLTPPPTAATRIASAAPAKPTGQST